jgi:hypothetical protein
MFTWHLYYSFSVPRTSRHASLMDGLPRRPCLVKHRRHIRSNSHLDQVAILCIVDPPQRPFSRFLRRIFRNHRIVTLYRSLELRHFTPTIVWPTKALKRKWPMTSWRKLSDGGVQCSYYLAKRCEMPSVRTHILLTAALRIWPRLSLPPSRRNGMPRPTGLHLRSIPTLRYSSRRAYAMYARSLCRPHQSARICSSSSGDLARVLPARKLAKESTPHRLLKSCELSAL